MAYKLTDGQKLERQANAVFEALKNKLAAHWVLFGDELEGEAYSFFRSLDKDDSGTISAAVCLSLLHCPFCHS